MLSRVLITGKAIRVGWLSRHLDPEIASARYRILLPAKGLERLGVQSTFLTNPSEVQDALPRLDFLVISKLVDAKYVALAARAYDVGVRVIIDLCDNVFLPTYAMGKGKNHATCLRAAACFATAIVTTGRELSRAVREHTDRPPPIVEIPDPLESRELVERLLQEHSQREGVSGLERTPLLRKLMRRSGIASTLAPAAAGARDVGKQAAWQHDGSAVRPPGRRKRLIWFGNYGAPYSDFGMLSLLRVADALERVNREIPLELLVVSNNAKVYDANIFPMPVPTRYLPWHPLTVFDLISASDLCVLPQSDDEFSRTKSANRAVLALSLGVPVVASKLASLEPLAGCVRVDDWYESVRAYLSDPRTSSRDVAAAQSVIAEQYELDAVARSWHRLLQGESAGAATPAVGPRAQVERTRLTVLVNLPMDLDLLLPVAVAAAERGFAVVVLVNGRAAAESPRIMRSLAAAGLTARLLDAEETLDKAPLLVSRGDIFLTASESTLRPHRVAHALAERAAKEGAATYTMQHGLENVGLSYRDQEHDEKVGIASQTILTWASPERLPDWLSPDTRSRCLAIGRTARTASEIRERPLVPREGPVVGVFENLHWRRYDDDYRQQFLDGLTHLVESRPDIAFLLKPHHAGKWSLACKHGLQRFSNVIVADPRDPAWEPFTAPAILSRCAAVITTPSTVALDAGCAGTPAALFAGELEQLDLYAPLPLLRRRDDWTHFVTRALGGDRDLAAKLRRFTNRAVLPGDAVGRFLELCSREVAAAG